jgi:threonine aldolase
MSVLDLTAARAVVSPEEHLKTLASKAVEFGVDRFDYYGDFSNSSAWLRRFEHEVASYVGKPDGVYLPSGVMAAGITMMISKKPHRNTFVCHHSSHLLLHEHEAYKHLWGMEALVIPVDKNASFQRPLSYEDVSVLLNASPPPAALFIELPHREIGGKCPSWSDLEQISADCRRLGIAFHMDGARFWEACAYYAETEMDSSSQKFSESYPRATTSAQRLCALFDSVYVSFYKGLGATSGAALLGSESFVSDARVWARRFGGNVFSALPLALSCWAAFRTLHSGFDDSKGTLAKDPFAQRADRLREVVALVTTIGQTEAKSSMPRSTNPSLCCELVRFDPAVPQCSLVHVYLHPAVLLKTAVMARDAAAAKCGLAVLPRNLRLRQGGFWVGGTEWVEQARTNDSHVPSSLSEIEHVYFEMNLGHGNAGFSDDDWTRG